jgi:hypothetical protein
MSDAEDLRSKGDPIENDSVRPKCSVFPKSLVMLSLLLFFFGMIWVLLFTLRHSEPNYEGKPFSYWLDQIPCTHFLTNGGMSMSNPISYQTRYSPLTNSQMLVENGQKALAIVSRNGGRHLPMLLRRLHGKDSSIKKKLVNLTLKLHLFRLAWVPSADVQRGQALTAIMNLGYSAKPIFSDLRAMANDQDPELSATARYALERLQPDEFERLEKLQQARKK